jgi:hypothetical protein
MLHWDYLPDDGLTIFKIGPLLVFGLARKVSWRKDERAAVDLSIVRREGGYIQRVRSFEAGVNIPRRMKEVSDEKNIQLLESMVSSQKRAPEFADEVGEITKLEVLSLIQNHRSRRPKERRVN